MFMALRNCYSKYLHILSALFNNLQVIFLDMAIVTVDGVRATIGPINVLGHDVF
jgi:hypothetical protein